MSQEKDFLILTSLVAIGIIFISGLAVIFHSSTLLPLVIIAILITPLILYQSTEKGSEFAENLEKVMFFITFAIICISIILLYRPL
jgi:energy-converting hydrogenase A subunit K